MGLIERRWANTVVVDGQTYVLAQEAQVELRDTNRAAWDRVKEAERRLEGAVAALREIAEFRAARPEDYLTMRRMAERAAREFGGQ